MIGLLAIIGIAVILHWVSKGLKKLSAWLYNLTGTALDVSNIQNKPKSNKYILRQTKIAEEGLQIITGEESNVAYRHNVQSEIEKLIKEVSSVK